MTIKLTEWEIQVLETLMRDKMDALVVEINEASKKRKLQQVEEKHSYHLELENLLLKFKKINTRYLEASFS